MASVANRAIDRRIAESKNIELVAYCAMNKRPNFKMAIQVVDGRWYLYTGHFWHNGWTIVDVTDPYVKISSLTHAVSSMSVTVRAD